MRYRIPVLTTLIVLGVIAIGASLIVRYALPYWDEQQLQKLDEQRIADINALDAALSKAFAQQMNTTEKLTQPLHASTSATSTASAIHSTSSTQTIEDKKNVVHISLPSDSPTCANYELPSLPEGWQYHCVSEENLTKTDGTGWVPVDLSTMLPALPIDPINDDETLGYYAYVHHTNYVYVLASILDSEHFIISFARTNESVDPFRYVLGTDKTLWAQATGLIEYIPFTKEQGSEVIDPLHPGRRFGLDNSHQYILKARNGAESIHLAHGSTLGFMSFGESKHPSLSIVARIYPDAMPQNAGIFQKGNSGYGAFNYGIFLRGNSFSFGIKNAAGEVAVASSPKEARRWHTIIGTFDESTQELALYVDNKFEMSNVSNTSIDYTYSPAFQIGRDSQNYFQGRVNYVALYNRVLTKGEMMHL